MEQETQEEAIDPKQPPKKRIKKTKKNPPAKGSSETEGKPKKKASKKSHKMDHPRTADMILEALENLADKNGSSVQAIKSYILQYYAVREDMIKNMMKRAIVGLLNSKDIGRPNDQQDMKQILNGRYVVGKGNKEEALPRKPRPPSLRQFKTPSKEGKPSATKKKKKKRASY